MQGRRILHHRHDPILFWSWKGSIDKLSYSAYRDKRKGGRRVWLRAYQKPARGRLKSSVEFQE